MRTLNLGILAHVDAGKTTLTERLLHAAGVINEIGRVDDGSTQTDSLALEKQRGITIKSAVVSFVIDGVAINLIDTPGHPDFIAEVERVLGVLDGAVLVVSAVEGVQPQTVVLMRTLRRLSIPALIFVNKIDRKGARYDRVLSGISARLTPAIVAMGAVKELGTRSPSFRPYGAADGGFASRLVDVLSERDDALLAAYVDDEGAISYRRLGRELAAQSGRALVHPVFFGSAITGAGVGALIDGITELLPAAEGDIEDPVSGTVFKVERGAAGEKIAFVRMFSGTVKVRDRLRFGRDEEEKVTAISVFDRGSDDQRDSVAAGRIGKLWGLGEVRIGDMIGEGRPAQEHHYFAPPTLETVVVPSRPADKGALHVALTQLAEQDPLIDVRQEDRRQELYVSLYGEVQKEVSWATLADHYGLDVTFRETTTICIERPIGIGAAFEIMNEKSNPFLATVGLRVEPASAGSGAEFRLDSAVHGTMPAAFFAAVEETVKETLRQGLHGWKVTDCTVTLTHTGYAPRQSHSHQRFNKSMSSTGADFRGLTPLVLMETLKRAGTTVCEPIHCFRLEIPADTFGAVASALARLRAVPQTQEMPGSPYTLEGEIPAARVHELQQRLPGLTRGEGVLESKFDSYQPVRGEIPTRPRSDHNPLDRKEYLLRVARRIKRERKLYDQEDAHRRDRRRRGARALIARRPGPAVVLALAALATVDTAPSVTRFDDEVVGWVPNADDDQFGDVGPEEVRGTGRIIAVDRGDAFGVGDILDKSGDLRVPRPSRQFSRPAVEREARVTPKIERLRRTPHAPEPEIPVDEVDLGGADARGSVAPEGSEGLVGVGIEETAGQGSELGRLGLHFAPARHVRPPILLTPPSHPSAGCGAFSSRHRVVPARVLSLPLAGVRS